MQRLQQAGVACAEIDITEIGNDGVKREQWYIGIISLLTNGFELEEFDLITWWNEHLQLSPNQKFSKFIKEILLPSTSNHLVIFIDEIDSVLGLDFPLDDFFALIRSCYNKRGDIPEYNRLSFCFLGVATPSSLIQDIKRTPFNIGQAIDLQGFKLDEAQPLIAELQNYYSQPQQVVEKILDWTEGQPFLTQKLCQLMAEEASSEQPREVDEIVRERIITDWYDQDEPVHLKTIKERLFRQENLTAKLLETYQQIWHQGGVELDDSREQIELRLSGLVVRQEGQLRIYNPIYREVFNSDWIELELEKLRPYGENLKAWLESDCQDESRLLSGKALAEALEWSAGKSLTIEDNQFLNACRELEKREDRRKLEIQKEESRILAQANETLEQANQREKRAKVLSLITGIFILITSIVLAIKYNQIRNLYLTFVDTIEKEVVQKSKISRSKQISLFNENVALLESLRAGKQLKLINKDANQNTETQVIASFISSIYSLPFRELKILDDHKQTARSVAFSPDNKLIATASIDETIKLWNLQGKLIQTFEGHEDKVMSVVFSPDGQTIASSSNDKTIKLWDLQGNVKQTLKGHEDKLRNISFSPDGKMLASAGWDDKVILWTKEGDSFKQFKSLEKHTDNVREVSFSPDGELIASAGYDNNIIIWTRDGEYVKTLKGHEHEVRSVNFSPKNSNLLASASKDKTIKLWDIEQGKVIENIEGNQDTIVSVRFSPDGKTLASAHWDDKVKLWNLEGKLLQTIEGYESVYEVNFSPDGKILASAHRNGLVKLWKKNTVPSLITLDSQESQVTSISLNSEDNIIATASEGKISLWNLQDESIKTFKVGESQITSISFSPNLEMFVTATIEGKIHFWSLEGEKLATIPGHSRATLGVNFSTDGDTLIASGSDEQGKTSIKLWKLDLDSLIDKGCESLQEYLKENSDPSNEDLCR